MHEITLIFPDQLFEHHPAITKERPIYLAEEFLFYNLQPFHKQRLLLLRASMRLYADRLKNEKKQLTYITAKELRQRGDLFALIAKDKIKTIHLAEFADEWLMKDLESASKQYRWNLCFYPSPAFICTNKELKSFFSTSKHYSMAPFYAFQRKKLNLLMKAGSPLGGKYSFDVENRKKIPKGLFIPPPFIPEQPPLIDQLIDEIECEFPNAIGKTSTCLYPTTHDQAKLALNLFLDQRFRLFGDYQDAMQKETSSLFHSMLSPLLNLGLLTPSEVIKTALEKASTQQIPFHSVEGFLRQIIGWREFVRASYLLKGSMQRSLNFFNHNQKIPRSFWLGNTGITPVDTIIQKALKTGYSNHIERLMVLGNFLLLTETSPDEAYNWFMANFVDAYDWVMVPNVYGMSQYADGGMITTKPYICASNYILKMSDYSKGGWCDIWDGLFWRFLRLHRSVFEANNRMSMLVHLLEKNKTEIHKKIEQCEVWLNNYRKREP